jgi:signal recognition particle receptor subunit beta
MRAGGFHVSSSVVASLNPLTRELVFKIVFYGPGLGGKTTTLQYIHATTKPEHRGKMVSLATPTDRTLYFDFLPLRVPRVRGMSVRLQLFTVPGQVYYGATRKLVLSGADGVVFVADSQSGRMDANQESIDDLHANLADHNKTLVQLPHTFHWNKRDLSDLVPLEELDRRFNAHGAPSLGTCATRGDGVFEGLERVTRLVLRHYESELPKSEQAMPGLSSGGAEVSIAEAIRGLAEAPLVSKITPFHGMAAVRLEDAKPSAESEARLTAATAAPALAPVPPPGASPAAPRVRMAPSTAIPPSGAPPPAVLTVTRSVPIPPLSFPPNGETVAPHDPAVPTVSPPEAKHFSLAELWPEADRESVRQTETLLGAGDIHAAVLGCDLLLTRILASAAALTGAADAPRDPGLVSLLLGLDGRRYLGVRALVRAARAKEPISPHEALECFAFVLDARRARDALGR